MPLGRARLCALSQARQEQVRLGMVATGTQVGIIGNSQELVGRVLPVRERMWFNVHRQPDATATSRFKDAYPTVNGTRAQWLAMRDGDTDIVIGAKSAYSVRSRSTTHHAEWMCMPRLSQPLIATAVRSKAEQRHPLERAEAREHLHSMAAEGGVRLSFGASVRGCPLSRFRGPA
jgi:hypothetical protein